MPRKPSDRERVRKATLDVEREPHHRNDDEDIHPARLDEAERKLKQALDDEPDA